ncbi:hypothetical protein [Rubrobacter indicoceani]|uniref:hypothetical protein n=1 Tax=Rubrobacter indicoceani TaxID=2051957 RepID=UPI000E5BE9EB|nr:hypothetical protein [Rubrobacter indicoceani]
MTLMINPRNAVVVLAVTFLSLGLSGCSLFSGSQEEASTAFEAANASIDRHNQLFAEARDTYDAVRTDIESGEDPGGQRRDIVQARQNLQEARGHLRAAGEELSSITGMNVEEPVREYADTFTRAVDEQLAAEATEVRFYELLERNPSLDGSRDEALELLEQVGAGYASAEEEYARAQRLANENSDLISPTDSGNTR